MLAVHSDSGTIQPATTALSSLGYSGEFFDAAAQQQYLRARFYNPANGRFNRLDPFAGNTQDPQSLHKYAYVHGDPIGGVDPTGLYLGGGGLGIGLGFSSLTSLNVIKDNLASTYFQKTTIDAVFLSQFVNLDLGSYFRAVSQSIDLINTAGLFIELALNAIFVTTSVVNGDIDFLVDEDFNLDGAVLARRGKGFSGKYGWWSRNRHLFKLRMVQSKNVHLSKGKFNPDAKAMDLIDKKVLMQLERRAPKKAKRIKAGATNKELMEEGMAPIGRDGHEMNLHHSTRQYQQGREPNTLIELPGSVHTKFTKELHKVIGNSAVDRAAFDKYRKAFWKWRSDNPGHE